MTGIIKLNHTADCYMQQGETSWTMRDSAIKTSVENNSQVCHLKLKRPPPPTSIAQPQTHGLPGQHFVSNGNSQYR